MNSKEFKEALSKLGIKNITEKHITGESKDILFSKFDTCLVKGIEYLDGNISERKIYRREISENFNKVWKYLQKFGYEIDMDYYDSKRYSTLECDFEFHGKGLPNLNIDINKFHNNLYKIKVNYDRDHTFYDMKDYKKVILSKLEKYANKNEDVRLLRNIKLSKLI